MGLLLVEKVGRQWLCPLSLKNPGGPVAAFACCLLMSILRESEIFDQPEGNHSGSGLPGNWNQCQKDDFSQGLPNLDIESF